MSRRRDPPPRRARRLHGREREVDRLVLLLRRRVPFVTVTGIPGIGRRRVIEEAARIASAFGTPLTRVRAATCPFGERGEHEVPLGPLRVPERVGGILDRGSIARSPAVSLLLDAASLDLEALTDANRLAVGELARRSDGHPAVLEHLAGWLWFLEPAELVRCLDAREVALVARAQRGALRAAFAALDSSTREVLRAVAVTCGPFDAPTARACVRASRRAHVPHALLTLVRAGFLLRSGAEDAPRFRVIAPLREVLGKAAERARVRLTTHLSRLAKPLLGPTLIDRTRVARILDARDEVLAAWEDARGRGAGEELSLAAALGALARSGDAEAKRLSECIEQTIESRSEARDTPALAIAAGDAAWVTGAPKRADRWYRVAAQGALRGGDDALRALSWTRRATLGPDLGDVEKAQRMLQKASALAHRSEDRRVVTLTVAIGGYLARARGDARAALEAYDEQSALAHRARDAYTVAVAEVNAADCHLALGEHALSVSRYERARRVLATFDPGWARILEGYMGLSAWESNALGESLPRFGRALRGPIAPRFRVLFGAARAAVLAELGELPRGRSALAAAEADAQDDTRDVATFPLDAARLLVAFAAATDAPCRRAIRARMRALAALRGSALAPFAEDERAFRAALARAGKARKPARETSEARRASAASREPTAGLRALEHRPRLRAVVDELERAGREGRPRTALEIFRAVWPTERVPRATAEARVRKSISVLRAFGLRGRLATEAGAYVLRPL